MTSVIVLIPFYNEYKNIKIIELLVNELSQLDINFKYIFCNDNSTDETSRDLFKMLNNNNSNFEIISNKLNLGHGGSLVRLSKLEIIKDFEYVLTLDFDFCYLIDDLKSFFHNTKSSEIKIGKRKFNDEGFFRQLITSCSELIILFKTLNVFIDTNCPIRLYPSKIFLEIWSKIPEDTLTPNIVSTQIILKRKYRTTRLTLSKDKSINTNSVSWGKNFLLKKLKILMFSFRSFKQLIFFKDI